MKSARQKHPLDIRTKGGKVRSATIRKLAKDGGLSPTEKLRKSKLMNQFSMRLKGYGVAISQEYRKGYCLAFHPEGCDCEG